MPWLRVSGIAEVSWVGVLRPLQPPSAARRGFAPYRSRGRVAGDDLVSLGVGHDYRRILRAFYLHRQKTWTFAENGTKMNMKSSPRRGSRRREKRRMVGVCSIRGQGYGRGDVVAGEPMGNRNALSYHLAEPSLPSPRLLFCFFSMYKMRANR